MNRYLMVLAGLMATAGMVPMANAQMQTTDTQQAPPAEPAPAPAPEQTGPTAADESKGDQAEQAPAPLFN